jgi:hypothetical protein
VNLFSTGAAAVNTLVRPLVASSVGDKLLGRWMTVVTYTGRRSGATFTIPVAYTRRDDDLTIRVEFPDQKKWWRNFTGEGGPILVRLDGAERTGHAVTDRDDKGQVTVSVHLAPA